MPWALPLFALKWPSSINPLLSTSPARPHITRGPRALTSGRGARQHARRHSRSDVPIKDKMVTWSDMRWVERLRLCEELCGRPIGGE
jgi:hypothetical protein